MNQIYMDYMRDAPNTLDLIVVALQIPSFQIKEQLAQIIEGLIAFQENTRTLREATLNHFLSNHKEVKISHDPIVWHGYRGGMPTHI